MGGSGLLFGGVSRGAVVGGASSAASSAGSSTSLPGPESEEPREQPGAARPPCRPRSALEAQPRTGCNRYRACSARGEHIFAH